MPVAAGLAGARDHALISLLARNGLRVSEVTGADIENLGLERGHRTLTISPQRRQDRDDPVGPADRPSHRPCGRRTLRGPDLRGWRRCTTRPSRHRADRAPDRPPAGIAKRVGPHRLRHAFITAALDAGVPLRDVQEAASHADPRTTMRYDRARVSLDRHATYIVATFVAGAARYPPPARSGSQNRSRAGILCGWARRASAMIRS
jgi:site-specific recombinase XerC